MQTNKLHSLYLVLLILFFVMHSIVKAQELPRVNIEYIDNNQFPNLEVYLSITDTQGFPVQDLNRNDFSLTEDGQPVASFEVIAIQNSKQPLAITLVIDTSESMGKQISSTSLQDTIQATKRFIDSLSQQDQIAIVGFASTPYVVQDFTTDKELAKAKLDTLTASGERALYDGIAQAIQLLKDRSEQKSLLLITNGQNNINGQFDFRNSIDEASRWAVPIYPIGFGEVDRSELEQMAILTGGIAQIDPSSSDLELAFNKVQQILREQYLIRYTSILPADNKEHNFQITVYNIGADIVSASKTFIARPGELSISPSIQDGQVVTGMVLLKPVIIDSNPLERMDIQLDGKLLQSVLSEPFEYMWDSTTVNSGVHVITFIIKDVAGYTRQASVTVNVQHVEGTPNPMETLQAAFGEIDRQFENLPKANIAFNKPEQMRKDETANIELILNLSMSQAALATQLAMQGGFVTSTADPNLLIAPSGESVTIETGQIEITPRVKAVLLSQDEDAFVVKEMHENAEQVISTVNTTSWLWSITAKKEGQQTLVLTIYQLIKYDNREFWHDIATYTANIDVNVTASERIKSLDWKWVASAIIIPLIVAFWGWLLSKNKKGEGEKVVKLPKKRNKRT